MAILHPNIYYFVRNGSWSAINSLEYWNKGNTATNANNNVVKKTAYDPSITNYSLPRSAVFASFSISNISGLFNHGYNFYCNPNKTGYTIFLSAVGYRNIYYPGGGDGAITSDVGFYCTSGTNGTYSIGNLFFYNNNIAIRSLERAYGASVLSAEEN